MNIRIEKPVLNRPTPEQNLAIVDRWIADTADKLNAFIAQVNKEGVQNAGSNQITS